MPNSCSQESGSLWNCSDDAHGHIVLQRVDSGETIEVDYPAEEFINSPIAYNMVETIALAFTILEAASGRIRVYAE